MAWGHEKIIKYLRANAPGKELPALLQTASKRYSSTYPNIYMTYYSLPDWLDVFDLDKRLDQGKALSDLIAEYRFVAKKYQEKLAGLLDMIACYGSGKALFKEVSSQRHSCWIMPYWHYSKALPGAGYFNAMVRSIGDGKGLYSVSDGFTDNARDAYERGAPSRSEDGSLEGSIVGTGRGTNVVVFFSIETWKDKTDGAASAADEVLYHELVHVTRFLRGQVTMAGVSGGGGYGNIEEYFATVITNIYMSEKGKTKLRGDYGYTGSAPAKSYTKIGEKLVVTKVEPFPQDYDVMKDPDKFYQNPQKTSPSPEELMKTLRARQSKFYGDLAQLPEGKPKFNPVRKHYLSTLRPDI
jgi:hypothetical protein